MNLVKAASPICVTTALVSVALSVTRQFLVGLALSSISQSEGWEMELNANPTKNWRVTLNATETNAVVTQIGDAALTKFMTETAAYVKGVGGSQQWFWGENIAPSVPDVAQAYYIAYNGLPADRKR